MKTRTILVCGGNTGDLDNFKKAFSEMMGFSLINEKPVSFKLIKRINSSILSEKPSLLIIHVESLDKVPIIDRIIQKSQAEKVICILDKNNLPLIKELANARVAGLLSREKKFEEIRQAISLVFSGKLFLSNDIITIILESMTPNSVCPLTPKLKNILFCMSMGMSYSEIAREVEISPFTVKSHIKKIYRVLGVNRKSEAVSLAVKGNWIQTANV